MTTTREIISTYQDAFNRHDLAAIDALHSFDAIYGSEIGHLADLLAVFTNWFTLVPDVKCVIRNQAENGPVAFTEMTLAGTDTNGQPVERAVVLVIETADGLIVAERHYLL